MMEPCMCQFDYHVQKEPSLHHIPPQIFQRECIHLGSECHGQWYERLLKIVQVLANDILFPVDHDGTAPYVLLCTKIYQILRLWGHFEQPYPLLNFLGGLNRWRSGEVQRITLSVYKNMMY